MIKIRVAHYRNMKKTMYVNGGTLIISENEIILKCFFVKVAVFDKSDLHWSVIRDEAWSFKRLMLADSQKSYECLFYKKDFEKAKAALSRITT